MDPTSISLALVFRTPQIAKGVGGLLGIIESVDKKLDRLLSSDFDAGIRHLEELQIAKKEHEFLLKEAWKRFEIALTHEKGERKALAYIALSFCQYHLGEKECSLKTLNDLISYKYEDRGGRAKRHLAAAAIHGHALNFGVFLVWLALSPSNTRNKFFKWMQTIPSEERVNFLKEQARNFISEESASKAI